MTNKELSEALNRSNKAVVSLAKRNNDLWVSANLIEEMITYLDHGHGTSIGCESIFHDEMRKAVENLIPSI